ncbi:MAG: TSUP family transporter [Rhodospirillales bacterium]|nr:MAG: TSUP family transporter [Rhodospirillales bacterium]
MPLDSMPLLLATGAATGLLAGLVGIGGGIVVVPVLLGLYAAQGVPGPVALPLAVGTAQATVAAAALSAAFAHGRAGNIDRHLLAAWLPWALAGAVAGALLAPLAPTRPLAGFFALVAAVLAVRLLVPGGTGRPMDPLTGWRRRDHPPSSARSRARWASASAPSRCRSSRRCANRWPARSARRRRSRPPSAPWARRSSVSRRRRRARRRTRSVWSTPTPAVSSRPPPPWPRRSAAGSRGGRHRRCSGASSSSSSRWWRRAWAPRRLVSDAARPGATGRSKDVV